MAEEKCEEEVVKGEEEEYEEEGEREVGEEEEEGCGDDHVNAELCRAIMPSPQRIY